jgi:hypothetical protein
MTILVPRAESPTIKVDDIAYLRFGAFLALGLRARSAADLRTLAAARSTQVEAVAEPGGAEIVR